MCSWLARTISRTAANSGLSPSISAERSGCRRTIAHSSSESGPSLVMISSGTTLIPRSRKRLAVASWVSSWGESPSRSPTPRTSASSSVSSTAFENSGVATGRGTATAVPSRASREETNEAGIHWPGSWTTKASRSTRRSSTTNRPSRRRLRRIRRCPVRPRARDAWPEGSVSHSADRPSARLRAKGESVPETTTRRAGVSAIRAPRSRNISPRGSSSAAFSIQASTAGPAAVSSSSATEIPPSAEIRLNGGISASSCGCGVVLIRVLVRRGQRLHIAEAGSLRGLDQRASGLLERGQHVRLGLGRACDQLVRLAATSLSGRQHLGHAGLGLGVAVGERLLESLALLAQLLLERAAHPLALAARLVDDPIGVCVGVLDVLAGDLIGLVDQPAPFLVDVVDLERARIAHRAKLVVEEAVQRGDRLIDGACEVAKAGRRTLDHSGLRQVHGRWITEAGGRGRRVGLGLMLLGHRLGLLDLGLGLVALDLGLGLMLLGLGLVLLGLDLDLGLGLLDHLGPGLVLLDLRLGLLLLGLDLGLGLVVVGLDRGLVVL